MQATNKALARWDHDTAHAKASGHWVIQSLALRERHFTWCYERDAYV